MPPDRYEYILGQLTMLVEEYGDCLSAWEKVNFPKMLDPTRRHHMEKCWSQGQEKTISDTYRRVVVQADDIRDDAIERVGDCRAVPTAHDMIQMTVYDVPVGRPVSYRASKTLLPWLASAIGGLKEALADAGVMVETGFDKLIEGDIEDEF